MPPSPASHCLHHAWTLDCRPWQPGSKGCAKCLMPVTPLSAAYFIACAWQLLMKQALQALALCLHWCHTSERLQASLDSMTI